ncbi:hypothetical protein SCAB_64851 [Streptomyces scabiei 87.22]|uniref:Uncharacterized protein n=1 Tax=Streptomyces scabiei (strain 87.22) TaxID=680198 RepID=C9ZE56_STRSW|nr:hypothetical protein [Streptomyces scabiei]MBP5931901.1 hypothetical protein [Streptomyces sp. LBUM 1479]MDX3048964.1 hypothetical protein [Streptomyces scabiei]MDX3078710.1 hypothetical protein [Streptomyces scabiei]MDX3174355.1 hypothetical protein [Streptomyces scabiei]MDX3271219.1 hypothetical protein [Streptomyces scabiei]
MFAHPAKPSQASVRATVRALGPWFWEVVRWDPRASIPPYDPITGYRTWAEFEAAPPQFTGILGIVSPGVGESGSRG